MIIPERIKIGEHYYDIKKVRIISWMNNNVAGSIDYGNKLMKLKMFKVEDEKNEEVIFFHEVVHGILKEMEFNYPQINKFRNDEMFTQELALNLRNTFLDLLKCQENKL